MRRGRVAAIAVGAVATFCACSPFQENDTRSGIAHVHISLGGRADTVGFQIPVRARRCAGDRGVLLDGAQHGNGLLVWLRDGVGPPDGGNYPLLSRGDSAAPRGAIASVRYIVGTIAHGLIVDSGMATLTHETPPYAVHLKGNGTEVSIPDRRGVELTADRVALEPDTVNCVVQL